MTDTDVKRKVIMEKGTLQGVAIVAITLAVTMCEQGNIIEGIVIALIGFGLLYFKENREQNGSYPQEGKAETRVHVCTCKKKVKRKK